jgi:hypothetical protein
LLTVLSFLAAPANAAPVIAGADLATWYIGIGFGGPVNGTVTTMYNAFGFVNWSSDGGIYEQKPAVGPAAGIASVLFCGTLNHIVAPHVGDDARNRNQVGFSGGQRITLQVDPANPAFVGIKTITPAAQVVVHPNNVDDHFDTNTFSASASMNRNNINSYWFVGGGGHFPQIPVVVQANVALDSTSFPSVTTVSVEPDSGRCDVSLVVPNLTPLQIQSAQIIAGAPSTPSGVVVDMTGGLTSLGSGSAFTLGEGSCSANVSDLVNGNTYVQVVSSAGTMTSALTPALMEIVLSVFTADSWMDTSVDITANSHVSLASAVWRPLQREGSTRLNSLITVPATTDCGCDPTCTASPAPGSPASAELVQGRVVGLVLPAGVDPNSLQCDLNLRCRQAPPQGSAIVDLNDPARPQIANGQPGRLWLRLSEGQSAPQLQGTREAEVRLSFER